MGGPPTHHHREVEQPVNTSLLDRVDHAHSLNGLLVQHVPRDMGASARRMPKFEIQQAIELAKGPQGSFD